MDEQDETKWTFAYEPIGMQPIVALDDFASLQDAATAMARWAVECIEVNYPVRTWLTKVHDWNVE